MSKKSEITEYFVFNREWYELKKTVSKKVWDELFDLMLQLRFDGVDTDPQTIKSKTVRSYWVMIRVRILNSMERCERKKEERKRKMETNSESQQDMQPNTEFYSEPENNPNMTVITAEYPNPQPKAESPSEGQESGKNEVLEIKSSVPDVDDIDNDFRYAQTNPYENPELSFLLDDDEFEKFEEEWKNNEIIHKIICKVMDGNVNAEYVDDIVMILKRAIKDGIVDWSVIRDGVNSISLKHKRSKMEVDGLIKMVMSDMQAA